MLLSSIIIIHGCTQTMTPQTECGGWKQARTRLGLSSSSSSANTHTHNSGIWGCRLPRLELVTVRPFDLLKRASLFHALLHANLITDFAFPATQPASQRTLRHRPSPAAIIAVPGVFVHPPSSIAKSSKMRSTGDLPLSFPVIVTHPPTGTVKVPVPWVKLHFCFREYTVHT